MRAISATRRPLFSAAMLCATCLMVTLLFMGSPLAQEESAAAAGSAPPAGHYTIDDLGPFAPIADDVAVTINRDGAVAYWTRTEGSVRATVWQGGHAAAMEDVPGFPNSIAHAINRRGDIAGWMSSSGNLVDSMATTRGFVRTGGHIHIVAGLGGRDSRVNGLNDRGAAVGVANTASGARHGFLALGDRIIDLGTLPAGAVSAAYAIDNAGAIVGSADIDGKTEHAVEWVDRKIVDLGTLPDGSSSSAQAINERGQVVGFSSSPDGIHAFLYAGGAMRDLGTLGNDPSEASSINNRGEIVGASNVRGSVRHAFLWRNGRMADLNGSLPKGSGWVLLDAFSINDRGQIVCSGRGKGEADHLLLLTPQ